MSGNQLATRALSYELQVDIMAPKNRVWKAITDETNAWWLPDFHMLGNQSVVSFDCRAGGQLIESRPDGSSLLWYTVQMCKREESLYLVGYIAPDFGGPATTMLRLKLVGTQNGTTLMIQDSICGHIEDSTASCLEIGWAQLFGEGLKQYLEG